MLSTVRISVKNGLIHINKYSYTQLCKYARWSHRRPVRVLSDENVEEANLRRMKDKEERPKIESQETHFVKPSPIKWKHVNHSEEEPRKENEAKTVKKFANKTLKKKDTSTFDMLETVIDENGDMIYTKMANKDTRISMLMTTVKSKSDKVKKHVILLEGKRLISEALQNKCRLKYLLFSRKDDLEYLKPFLPKIGASVYKMPLREMQMWSDLTHCPGIMGIFDQPTVENITPFDDTLPITIICDNIREPGNLGAILRTSAAVGCQSVILTKGCVNLWDTKVTRGSCGAHFRLQIHQKVEWPQMKEKVFGDCKIFMADNKLLSGQLEEAEEIITKIQSLPLLPYYSVHFKKGDPVVLIIGGETEGLSADAYNFVYENRGARLNIPLGNGVESLNAGVAIGVLLFEIRKQMLLESKELLANKSTG